MRVKLTNKRGDWSKTEKWLKKHSSSTKELVDILQDYGRKGVAALSAATPVDSGKTASSWDYIITQDDRFLSLKFVNNNKTDTGIPIAILIQYGHGNGHGAYIRGRDYINPAIQPIFDEIEAEVRKEIVE